MRETGQSLSAVGVRYLRGAGHSKKLLLYRVICNDNPTNNGGTFIYRVPIYGNEGEEENEVLFAIYLVAEITRVLRSSHLVIQYT